MAISAVRLVVAGADFFLLPTDDTAPAAQALADELRTLHERGGTLRLRPRTAPDTAGWSHPDAEDLVPDPPRAAPLTGHEDPGTTWRDVLPESIGDVEVVELDAPTPLWHWATYTGGDEATAAGTPTVG